MKDFKELYLSDLYRCGDKTTSFNKRWHYFLRNVRTYKNKLLSL